MSVNTIEILNSFSRCSIHLHIPTKPLRIGGPWPGHLARPRPGKEEGEGEGERQLWCILYEHPD